MSFFDSIKTDIEAGVLEAAKTAGLAFIKEASVDALAFIGRSGASIERYAVLFIKREISLDEFKSLMLGLKDLAEMSALTEAGLAAIDVDNTRNAILRAVTSVALGAVSKIA